MGVDVDEKLELVVVVGVFELLVNCGDITTYGCEDTIMTGVLGFCVWLFCP